MLRIGDLVVAVKEIKEVEDGYAPIVHARPGDVGQIVTHGDMSFPAVRFGATVVDCVPNVEIVRWSAFDVTVSRKRAHA